MPFNFNKELWEYGRKIEDMALPIVNRLYDCDFKRNDNDIYDILDFRDEESEEIYKETLLCQACQDRDRLHKCVEVPRK